MRYLTAMSAAENGVAVSANEFSLRQTVGAKMLNCITKTVDGNALKNSERKDRHAPYFTRVPYLSKSNLCRRSYSVTVPQHRLRGLVDENCFGSGEPIRTTILSLFRTFPWVK